MQSDFQKVLPSPTAVYDEALRFFRGVGILNGALLRLSHDLDSNGIEYVVIGAVALNQHGYRRFTDDIDLLLTRRGMETFRERLVGTKYKPAPGGSKMKFRAAKGNVPVEMIISGEYPGDGKPKPVVIPEPGQYSIEIGGVKTLTLEKLVELKLASGISAPHRLKDLADVQELIKVKGLDAGFAERLDEYVRGKYVELYEAVRDAGGRD